MILELIVGLLTNMFEEASDVTIDDKFLPPQRSARLVRNQLLDIQENEECSWDLERRATKEKAKATTTRQVSTNNAEMKTTLTNVTMSLTFSKSLQFL